MIEATSKMEIDVLTAVELGPSVDLVNKHQMPAMVVHPQLIANAYVERGRRQGRFKIIVPVDWQKGENFGMLKVRGMTNQMLAADGFEFLLTGGKNEVETRNEAVTLSEFIYKNVSKVAEIRFVLGANDPGRTESNILTMCRAISTIRTPALVRTDHHLKVQVTKGSVEAQKALADKIREHVPFPLKASGNFTTAKAIASCPWAKRIAVSLTQAQQIIKDLSRQPDGLREMLSRAD